MILPFLKRFAVTKIAKSFVDKQSIFDWQRLIEPDRELWNGLLEQSGNLQNVLLATSMGGYLPGLLLDGLLAVALTLRGAKVHILLCDAALPACQLCDVYSFPNQNKFAKNGPKGGMCNRCFSPAYDSLKQLGVEIHRYTDFIQADSNDRAEATAKTVGLDSVALFQADGIAIGEHALAGALRFYARGDLKSETFGEEILNRYVVASLLTKTVSERVIDTYDIQCASFHHGIYVPQGIVGEVCRKRNVRVVNWHVAYRKKCFIFSHDHSYHHTFVSEPVSSWTNLTLTKKMDNRISNYLKSRWYGTKDWISFQNNPEFDTDTICTKLGIDRNKPRIGMLTSVVWDAQLHYESNAFSSMMDWVFVTVDYFRNRPDLQLLVRVHPAEVHGMLQSRQRVASELLERYGRLPKNIIIVPPESTASTYALMSLCDSVIIYNTKTGIELSAIGIPVVVAGEAWIKNKGFSTDAKSPASYIEILDSLPFGNRLSDETTTLAKKYAYHFFYRRMIPLDVVKPGRKFHFKIDLNSILELSKGKQRGVDIICDGILNTGPFTYPAESILDQ